MNKSSLIAFTDGVIAIIITILIMGLDKPSEPTFEAFWAIRVPFMAYMLSFIYIAAMWIKFYYEWYDFDKVNVEMICWILAILFFASILPYSTDLAERHFFDEAPQVFYGVNMVCITLSATGLNKAIIKMYPDSYVASTYSAFKKRLYLDLGIKLIGFVLCLLIWPPLMMIAIFITSILLVLPYRGVTIQEIEKKVKDE